MNVINERSLSFNLILYPKEDNSHYQALEKIKNNYKNNYSEYAYIIHDRDYNNKNELKKEHVHVTIKFHNSRWKNAVALELGITPNYLQKCNNLENSLKYLIHYNNNDKFQYSIEDVHGSLKSKLIQFLDNVDVPESEKLLSILHYINNYDSYLSMSNLLYWLCSTPLLNVYKKYAYSINLVLNEHNFYFTNYKKE